MVNDFGKCPSCESKRIGKINKNGKVIEGELK
jgi:hypothetical protein